ncbi:MAG TPA: hypothetical protein VI365_32900 [Trebonia sp.]
MQKEAEFERTHLERLKLAADVILSEAGTSAVGDALEAELVLFKDRVERALLLPSP